MYEADCSGCRAIARRTRALPSVGAVASDADAARSVVGAQYRAAPDTTILLDRSGGQVYAGRAIAAPLSRRAGTAEVISSLDDHTCDFSVVGRHDALSTTARAALPALAAATADDAAGSSATDADDRG